MVAGTTGLLGHHTVEAKRPKIESVNEGVDHANRILLANVIVKRLWQELSPILGDDLMDQAAAVWA